MRKLPKFVRACAFIMGLCASALALFFHEYLPAACGFAWACWLLLMLREDDNA